MHRHRYPCSEQIHVLPQSHLWYKSSFRPCPYNCGTDTTADYNPHSLVKIFLCKLCTLSKCDTGDKICFLFSVMFISSIYRKCISCYCHIIIFSGILISEFFVSLPIKITLFIIAIVLSAATLLLHILHHLVHCLA